MLSVLLFGFKFMGLGWIGVVILSEMKLHLKSEVIIVGCGPVGILGSLLL